MTAENPEGRTDTASRLIQASPERIYEAFTDGSTLMHWLPPHGMTGRALEYQFQEGGHYRIELRYGDETQSSGKTTDRTDVTKGRFVEIVAGRRIRQTVEFESDDKAFSREMTMTWTFDPAPQGTSVSVTAENVPFGDQQRGSRQGVDLVARKSGGLRGASRLTKVGSLTKGVLRVEDGVREGLGQAPRCSPVRVERAAT